MIVFCALFIFSMVGSSFSTVLQGGTVVYDENKIQDYAQAQYDALFASSGAYEDCLLITFLVEDEEYYDYHYVAWSGYHIHDDVRDIFGNEQTVFGQTIDANVSVASYKHSLDKNLADVVDDLSAYIAALGVQTYECTDDRGAVRSRLINKTGIAMSETLVNEALASFTEETGVPVVLLVEDRDVVFGRQLPIGAIFTVLVVIVIIVALVVSLVRKYNQKQQSGNDNEPNDFGTMRDQYW